MTIWFAVHVALPPSASSTDDEVADLVANALFDLGASGLEWKDEEAPIQAVAAFLAAEVIEPSEEREPVQQLALLVRQALDGLDLGASLINVHPYDEVDWATRWRGFHAPLSFGDLKVVPSWLEAPKDTTLFVRIDPSSAFGTGLHATTALCLDWLVEARPSEVLDVGTGTGILALSAVKLGARRAVGVDTDPEAIRVAEENRALNQVSDAELLLSAVSVSEVDGVFSVVVANILASVLSDQAAVIAARVSPGGVLVLSGLLPNQVEDVVLAYEAEGLLPETLVLRGEWARVTLVRPQALRAA